MRVSQICKTISQKLLGVCVIKKVITFLQLNLGEDWIKSEGEGKHKGNQRKTEFCFQAARFQRYLRKHRCIFDPLVELEGLRDFKFAKVKILTLLYVPNLMRFDQRVQWAAIDFHSRIDNKKKKKT